MSDDADEPAYVIDWDVSEGNELDRIDWDAVVGDEHDTMILTGGVDLRLALPGGDVVDDRQLVALTRRTGPACPSCGPARCAGGPRLPGRAGRSRQPPPAGRRR